MSISIIQGDTIDVGGYLVAGESRRNVPIDVTELGWQCRAIVLDGKRRLVNERPITDIQAVENSVPHFVALFTIEESMMMSVNDGSHNAKQYYWQIEVMNSDLEYKKTLEIALVVTPKEGGNE